MQVSQLCAQARDQLSIILRGKYREANSYDEPIEFVPGYHDLDPLLVIICAVIWGRDFARNVLNSFVSTGLGQLVSIFVVGYLCAATANCIQ